MIAAFEMPNERRIGVPLLFWRSADNERRPEIPRPRHGNKSQSWFDRAPRQERALVVSSGRSVNDQNRGPGITDHRKFDGAFTGRDDPAFAHEPSGFVVLPEFICSDQSDSDCRDYNKENQHG